MAKITKKGAWYTAFAVVLGAIGTFLVSTEPIFHYSQMFERTPIDTTQVVKNIDPINLDSFPNFSTPKIKTLSQISKEVDENKKKNVQQDSLLKKHEEFFK